MSDKEFQKAVKISGVDVDLLRVGQVAASVLALLRQAQKELHALSPSTQNALDEYAELGTNLNFAERNAEALIEALGVQEVDRPVYRRDDEPMWMVTWNVELPKYDERQDPVQATQTALDYIKNSQTGNVFYVQDGETGRAGLIDLAERELVFLCEKTGTWPDDWDEQESSDDDRAVFVSPETGEEAVVVVRPDGGLFLEQVHALAPGT